MPFSVHALADPIRVYSLPYPIYSPSVLCQTYVMNECTIFKRVAEDDEMFRTMALKYDPRLYHVFSVYEDCPGIDHVGIVHFLSGMFSSHQIPILYVNTYSYNLIFISEEYLDTAVALFKTNPRLIFTQEQGTL